MKRQTEKERKKEKYDKSLKLCKIKKRTEKRN